MKRIVIAFVVLLATVSSLSAAEISQDSLLISSNNQVYEYSIQGDFLQSFPTEYPGGYTLTEYARDIVMDHKGVIHVYNGTFSPYVSSYDTNAESWNHLTADEFSTANNISYGGIDVFGTTVFASDMATSGGEAQGIVAFDTTDGTVQRFAENIEPIDLTIGLDGLLYALLPGGEVIHVYHPTTFVFVDSLALTGIPGVTDNRSIAVDYNGDIFVADWEGSVHHLSNTEQLLASISPTCDWVGFNIKCEFIDIDISQEGEIALGTRFGEVFVTDTEFSTVSTFDVGSGNIFVEFAANPTISVDIDINANSEQNYINLKSTGLISVVVFTTESLNAAEIDPATLGFGPNAAPALQNRIFIKDVDGDGDLDLFVYFYVSQTGIACTDSEAVLTGETITGQKIEGSDFITVISRCP